MLAGATCDMILPIEILAEIAECKYWALNGLRRSCRWLSTRPIDRDKYLKRVETGGYMCAKWPNGILHSRYVMGLLMDNLIVTVYYVDNTPIVAVMTECGVIRQAISIKHGTMIRVKRRDGVILSTIIHECGYYYNGWLQFADGKFSVESGPDEIQNSHTPSYDSQIGDELGAFCTFTEHDVGRICSLFDAVGDRLGCGDVHQHLTEYVPAGSLGWILGDER